MVDVVQVRAQPLTRTAFAPYGQVLSSEPDLAEIGTRDGEEFMLNILTYAYRELRCDHLNAHHRATQALFAMGRPALLVVAPAGTAFDDHAALDGVEAFVIDGTAGVNLAYGTWHWGPYPLGDEVSLINLQGRGFADDNEVAQLERDLNVVIEVLL